MTVVAEGVETEAQLQYLQGQGCDDVQGFYLAKPLQFEEFREVVRAIQGKTRRTHEDEEMVLL